MKASDDNEPDDVLSAAGYSFLKALNNYHPNVPDLGPHSGVNIQVSKYTHLNTNPDGTLTPTSTAISQIDDESLNAIATDKTGTMLPRISGEAMALSKTALLDPKQFARKLRFAFRKTKDMTYDKATNTYEHV